MLLNSVQTCYGTDLYGHRALSCVISDVGSGFSALIRMLDGKNYLAFFPFTGGFVIAMSLSSVTVYLGMKPPRFLVGHCFAPFLL